MGSAQVDEGYGFAAVADVLADPFPPGLDAARVRLPTVPRLRSAEDDASHHRAYWRAHVWAALRRYQVAFEDPACPPWLRADHARVADEARRLLDRATATHDASSPPPTLAAPPAAGVHGQDFFPPAAATRGLDLRLSLRGARGLRRGRELTEGRPGADPVADTRVVEDHATDSSV
jgi:hypothetical protein